ncbi:MAG: hypothetical protein ACX94C_07765 [Phycisphaerales bacterium]
MPTNDNASTELTELWELLGKGTHEAWPECVGFVSGKFWTYREWVNDVWLQVGVIQPDHALAIVRDSVEGWLLENGWRIEKVRDGEAYSASNSLMEDYKFFLLPEALRYAMENA